MKLNGILSSRMEYFKRTTKLSVKYTTSWTSFDGNCWIFIHWQKKKCSRARDIPARLLVNFNPLMAETSALLFANFKNTPMLLTQVENNIHHKIVSIVQHTRVLTTTLILIFLDKNKIKYIVSITNATNKNFEQPTNVSIFAAVVLLGIKR